VDPEMTQRGVEDSILKDLKEAIGKDWETPTQIGKRMRASGNQAKIRLPTLLRQGFAEVKYIPAGPNCITDIRTLYRRKA
jgi:hypothetical protein